ncbi:hypothetical protein BDV98DRAFT_575253 [Pterulicium gracile]|uniref:Uncharacterized protein n=1 Tax=Pterulicium gracile TaxID=1884261 RepID=A0A5C3Q4G0_9AGAR|nr:hypothetical protein BDV98DRAFT_575253 [Pterula gracilis]
MRAAATMARIHRCKPQPKRLPNCLVCRPPRAPKTTSNKQPGSCALTKESPANFRPEILIHRQ